MRRRLAVSFNSWFYKPEFGMKEYEIVTRGSAAVLRASVPCDGLSKLAPLHDALKEYEDSCCGGKSNLFLVTCLHNVYPFRYPNYYSPEDPTKAWVQRLEASDMRFTARISDEDGGNLDSVKLDSKFVVPHDSRDMALLRFHDIEEGFDFVKRNNVSVVDILLPRSVQSNILEKGSNLTFCGHSVESKLENNMDVSSEIPALVSGKIEHLVSDSYMYGQAGKIIGAEHVLAATSDTLSTGMCGGPVFDDNNAAIGIVEGVLTKQVAERMGSDELASIIPTRTIQETLEEFLLFSRPEETESSSGLVETITML